ncbi:MAG TPA: hypothetical protein V6C81_29340 [Planktothrix sp.]
MAINLVTCCRCVIWEACAPQNVFADEVAGPIVARSHNSSEIVCGKCGDAFDARSTLLPRGGAEIVSWLVQDCSLRVRYVSADLRSVAFEHLDGNFAGLLTWCEERRPVTLERKQGRIPTPSNYLHYVAEIMHWRGAVVGHRTDDSHYALTLAFDVEERIEEVVRPFNIDVVLTHKLDDESRARLQARV